MNIDQLASLLDMPSLQSHLMQVQRVLLQEIDTISPVLKNPAQRMIKHSGKMLRPILLLASVKAGGGKITDKVITACAALECVHISSLIHDDIIDNSSTRRGQPTINSKEGLDNAILVGDYLLATGQLLASQVDQNFASTLASAFADMCEGQAQEGINLYNLERSTDEYFDTLRKKCSALISVACVANSSFNRLSDSELRAFATYGDAFGIAFQLIDDFLDLVADPSKMNKPVGNDIKEGVYTLPLLLGLQGPSRNDIKILITQKTLDTQRLIKLLLSDGSIQKAVEEIDSQTQRAQTALEKLPKSKTLSGLRSLPRRYLEQELTKQTVI